MSPRRIRCHDERGFVIVYVLALIAIAMTLGAAAIADTLSSRQLTTHDQRARRAQQASDAGIQSMLYDQSEASVGSAYNFTGGVLGLSNLLDCAVPQFNANLQVAGVTAYASSGGVCPQALTSSGSPVTSAWTPVGNHAYFDSEYLSNKTETGSSGVGSAVYFPEILSIGCDAISAANCYSGSSRNVYSRELAIFAPTGPLQAVEGTGNVTLNGLSVLGLNAAVAVNGNVSSGATLTVPAISTALNTNFTLNSVPNTSVQATFAYKNLSGSLISTANKVQISGFCSAASPATNCAIKRQPISITTTTCANCTTGITGGGYDSSNDTFTLTGGTATFAAGDYVFCNFNATGGTINTTASSTRAVRIFILPPNAAPCNGYTYQSQEKTTGTSLPIGNFTAKQGINNSLSDTVNNVSNVVDPSGLQIYVQGDGSYDNNTSVEVDDPTSCTGTIIAGLCVGGTLKLNQATESMVIYAPTSSVTVNAGTCLVGVLGSCTLGNAGAFEGSIVGDNTSVTATAITQDLDLGNYPLYDGTTLLQPVQYVQCDSSRTSLAGSTTDTSGC